MVGQHRWPTASIPVRVYGPRLNPQGVIDLANAMRSYVGLNITTLALAGLGAGNDAALAAGWPSA